MDSILTSIKKMLGIEENYEHFDTDIIIHINSAFATLTQLGVGDPDGFLISDKTTTWHDYVGDDKKLEAIKSYVYLRVKLLFDPPTSSSVMESYKNTANEFEWRINANAESESTSTTVQESN